jgi:hypothetical protein
VLVWQHVVMAGFFMVCRIIETDWWWDGLISSRVCYRGYLNSCLWVDWMRFTGFGADAEEWHQLLERTLFISSPLLYPRPWCVALAKFTEADLTSTFLLQFEWNWLNFKFIKTYRHLPSHLIHHHLSSFTWLLKWSLTGCFHYCKLLSPARAMEWIYVDGLRLNRHL